MQISVYLSQRKLIFEQLSDKFVVTLLVYPFSFHNNYVVCHFDKKILLSVLVSTKKKHFYRHQRVLLRCLLAKRIKNAIGTEMKNAICMIFRIEKN